MRTCKRGNVLSLLFFSFILGVVFSFSIHAQTFRVQTSPSIIFPAGDGDIYGIGGGLSVVLSAEIFQILPEEVQEAASWTQFVNPWAGIHYHSIPPAASELDASLRLTSFGGGLGTSFFPRPRIIVAGTLGAGLYVGKYLTEQDAVPTGNLYWEAGTELGYRISPGFTVSAKANYIDYRRQTDSLYKGVSLSLVADLALKSKNSEGRVILDGFESRQVYPIISERYQREDFGSITIKNAESAEIRNVEVYFSAGDYSSSPQLCGKIDYMPRNGRITFPLHASFSERVMNITEEFRSTGQVVIDYELLDEPRTSTEEFTISFHDRNSFVWSEPRILVSFISPNDQALLDFSKYVAGLVRSDTRPELDSNLQYALALFEGLRLANIAWGKDPQTPYSEMHRDQDAVDYVQYPYQTLAYKGGDSDDLAVLYSAAVESVGVPSAIIPIEEDVIVAVKLESQKATVGSFFSNPEDCIFIDDEVWVPVRMTMLREGFLRAWREGSISLKRREKPENLLIRIDDAWKEYPPAGVPDIRITSRKPAEDQVRRAFNNLVGLVVEREVEPKAERMRSSFGSEGASGRQHNGLGVLYARYGVYEEALQEFQAAAEAGYSRAEMNIGNIAFLLGDYETALTWYKKVENEYPDNPTVLISLARTYYELDRFGEADAYFKRAAEQKPEFVERYNYLSARVSDSYARASAAADRLGDMLWEE